MVEATDDRLAAIESQLAALRSHPVCQVLREETRTGPCHLVGGALRDTALGRPLRDLDIVVAGDGSAVADRLAARFGSRSIRVGGHRFAAYRIAGAELPIDLWDRGRVSLEADLRRRDFTIHSLALDLDTGLVADPFSGLRDLAGGRLRMTSAESFADDPLRVLRLCRFAAQLTGFRVDAATLDRARNAVGDLMRVASERIRNELGLSLALGSGRIAAQLWLEVEIIPEALLGTPLDAGRRADLIANLDRAWSAFEDMTADLPTSPDLAAGRLALILDFLAREDCCSISTALETLRQRGLITRTWSQKISRLYQAGDLTTAESQQRWFLHCAGELWPLALGLAAARAASEGEEGARASELTDAVGLATQRAEEIFTPPWLLSGEDLVRNFAIEPGARLGRVLAQLHRRQIEGSITTTSEALELATALLAGDKRD